MSRQGLRWPLFLVALLTALAGAPVGLVAAEEGPTATQPSDGTEEKGWEYSGSVYGYLFFEGSGDFLAPIVSAQRGPLYFEGRYNYEERDTGSLFGGYQFSFGKEVTLDLTPMLGAVVGKSTAWPRRWSWISIGNPSTTTTRASTSSISPIAARTSSTYGPS